MSHRVLDWTVSRATEAFNRVVPWHALPRLLGLANLAEIRKTLRAENLFDTSKVDPSRASTPNLQHACTADPRRLSFRSIDGSYNDLREPRMGSVGTRFGRNVPLDAATREDASLLTPNPRVVAERLLARRAFQPATSLNLIAAAWIQFMTHDWFSHGENDPEQPIQLPSADDDPAKLMRVSRTRRDPTRCPYAAQPPTHVNAVTHWWDASQLYGSDAATQARLRSGIDGKLRLGDDGRLPVDPATGASDTGFATANGWVGLGLLHLLFTLEHNSVCDRLKLAYPTWSDDEIFGRSRLVIAALLAKIHTIEWTPALLSHPTARASLEINWWGLESERVQKTFGRLSSDEFVSGIPGSATAHHGVPFSITEEFVAVYRMHSLLPDEVSLRTIANGSIVEDVPMHCLLGARGQELLRATEVDDALYTFGVNHPGALRLHNYPTFLRTLERDGSVLDLAAVDILRDRERGVPRYNAFRRHFHMPPARSFEELTGDRREAAELSAVYRSVEEVDLLVGLHAEPLPPGFAFSETAFRLFILMASRRIGSDRFFTTDFTPQVYTPEGMEWIASTSMTNVLLRHFPSLTPALRQVENAFTPWTDLRADGLGAP